MLLKGNVTIQATGINAWDFLTDSNQIGACKPLSQKIARVFYDEVRKRLEMEEART